MVENISIRNSFGLYLRLIVCAAIGGIAGWSLYSDLYQAHWRGTQPVTGLVKSQFFQVKRKSSESFLWNRLSEGQFVYLRDSVFAGPESSVTLNLNDGSVLEIGENSLVVLSQTETLSPSHMRGNFILRNPNGDKELIVDSTGKLSQKELTARLLSPPAEEINYTSHESDMPKSITFQWSRPKNEAPLQLAISTDKNFSSESTRVLELPFEATQTKVSLTPGKYFWRLLQNQEPITEVRKFRITRFVSFSPTFPNQIREVEQWGESGQTEFRWNPSTAIPDSTPTWIIVANDSAFKNEVMREPVAPSAGRAIIGDLPEGVLYWRLLTTISGTEHVSASQSFRIKKSKILPVELKQDTLSEGGPLPERYLFSWDFAIPQAEFEITLQRIENNETRQVFQKRVKGLTTEWKTPEPGSYQWQVKAFRNQMLMGSSDWGNITFFNAVAITLKQPAPQERITHWEQPTKINFDWKSPEKKPAHLFLIEIATDASFKKVVHSTETQSPPYLASDFTPADGSYFWRVKALDTNRRIQNMSFAAHFSYELPPLLKSPNLIHPKDGLDIAVLRSETDPFLDWEPIEGAINYEVSLRSEKTKNTLQEIVNKPTMSLKGFGAGKYAWSVRAIDRIQRKGEPGVWRTFTLHFGQLPAPKSVISEVQ